eukprot:705718-Karenia_brevis.AAC.1
MKIRVRGYRRTDYVFPVRGCGGGRLGKKNVVVVVVVVHAGLATCLEIFCKEVTYERDPPRPARDPPGGV